MMEDIYQYINESLISNRGEQAKEMVETIIENFEDISEISVSSKLRALVKESKSKNIEESEAALAKIRAVFKATNDIKKVLNA